jgi:hypothetical protein
LDNELNEAKEAQDDINNYADKDGATSDGKDNIGIQTIALGDLAVMKILAKNGSVCGTMAARLARVMQKAEAAPGWTGTRADYEAWVEALHQEQWSPEAALIIRTPEWAYLAILNGSKHFSVLHHLHQWKAPDGVCSRLEG